MGEQDKHQPGDKWEFNREVTDCFDDMLERSIPQYDVMRKAVFDIGCTLVKPQTFIVDLGCSRGQALAPFVEKFNTTNRYLGVEVSEPMADAARRRFGPLCSPPTSPVVSITQDDLRTQYPIPVPPSHGWRGRQSSLTMSVLTLMFTPLEYRTRIINNVFNNLIPGGGFILVEKVIGSTAQLDTMMVDHYYAMKENNGYSKDDILRKKLALEGVQVPVTPKWNEELLKDAGFRHVDCFWRWMNFAAWVAVK